ncbi:MAG: hypothetical protein A2X94_11190 [Bdellovibrionales bacterium GWB1_55_8]|nr:MAG: hypothetical protein A2X94_11190 [Bdellovibrionales bacterium GWB1_55_8]
MKKGDVMKSALWMVAAVFSVLTSLPANATFMAVSKFEAIQLKNVPPGKAISVFYVSGREGALGTVGQSLNVRSIKHGPVRVLTTVHRQIRIPAAEIRTFGFDVPNYIVFVVHAADQETVYLKNVDGTIPEDPRIAGGDTSALDSGLFKNEHVAFMSVFKFNKIRVQQGMIREAVELDFEKDL